MDVEGKKRKTMEDENVKSSDSAKRSKMDNIEEGKTKFIQCETFVENQNGENFRISLPESRVDRSSFSLDIRERFEDSTWMFRVQKEYNSSPVGPYVGPYDQSECVPLSAQLCKSDLNYARYTEFIHDDEVDCHTFTISTEYDDLDDLEKLAALEIDDKEKDSDEVSGKVYYSCQKKKSSCKVPCPCKDCCTDEVHCKLHKVGHPKLFNPELHAISIRGSDNFCEDSSFFSPNRSYVNKYANIPVSCDVCQRDLLHHDAYHIEYHPRCQYCQQNKFKLKPETAEELRKDLKEEENYYKTVCHICDKRFRDIYNCTKHIEYTHVEVPFKCDICEKRFTSKAAKSYHEEVTHRQENPEVKCEECDKTFSAIVSLKAHQKYVHSDEKKFNCDECDAKFKQKRDLYQHIKHVHNFDMKKETYGQPLEEFKCDQCTASFKYKKNLNEHMRRKHSEGPNEEFTCLVCEKIFNQKNNLVRHQKTHDEQK